MQADVKYKSPGLIRIFAAMVYDSLLLAALSIAYGALVVGLRVFFQGAPEAGQRIHWTPSASIFITLGWFFVLIAFYVYFWKKFGQTLGMKTWRIQMIDARTMQLASLQQCIVRGFAALLSIALLGFGYWCKLFHPQHKMLHDLISGTQLILIKK